MGDRDVDSIGKEDATKWDPGFTEQIKKWAGPVIKRYFRAEVRGLDAVPSVGGALLVSNHSGGMLTPDVMVFARAFYDKFGFDRPVFTLAHSALFIGPIGEWLHRAGVIEANRANAEKALLFFPPNLPLPTKIVTQVLEPIDVVEEFGEDPDVDAVDAHVRKVMQTALDKLAKKRPFPILG